jgi:hypothetical protein
MSIRKKVALKKEAVREPEEFNKVLKEAPLPTIINNEETSLVESKYFLGKYQPVIEAYSREAGIKLNPEEIQIVEQGFKKRSSGILQTIPITCRETCPFKTSCPFVKINKMPLGQNCIVERMVLDTTTKRYLDEFGVLVDSFSEVTLMTQLAATHILEMRALMVLADQESATGLIENVVGFNENEEPIIQTVEHPAFQLLERAWNQREKLLTALVGTRREQYKKEAALKQKTTIGPASIAADLRSKIDKLSVISDMGDK